MAGARFQSVYRGSLVPVVTPASLALQLIWAAHLAAAPAEMLSVMAAAWARRHHGHRPDFKPAAAI
jgi:hypothetical protein